MKNNKGDYSNKRVISLLLTLFSYLATLGLFYFLIVQFHHKSYLRGFGDLERILIEVNSTWIDPIQIWFADFLQEGNVMGAIWAVLSLIIASELIKFSLKAYLFNDNAIEAVVSDLTGIEDPDSELKQIMQLPGMSIWGNYLLKPSDPGYSEETKEKAKNLSRGRKLSAGLMIGYFFLFMFSMLGIFNSV